MLIFLVCHVKRHLHKISFVFSDAPYLTALSAAVVKLQESGKLSELRTRWWEQRRGGGKCSGVRFIQFTAYFHFHHVAF